MTTIEEKSLGAVATGGSTPLRAVYGYAEPVTSPGPVFMDTPGFDPVSVTRSSPSPPAGGPRARSSASATRSSPRGSWAW
ncbi:MAG TPA: hypothetical protein VFN87_13445 [Solirubrobacteraceae bacterium]|nr:hypothetical protein [Solirubrobacteraceae bacterium]